MAKREQKAKNKKAARAVPCGLTIKLEKDLLGKRLDTDDGEHVLGYFDRLYIRPVERWLDFSPKNTAPTERGGTGKDDGEWPISSYPIKLLFPTSKDIKELEKCGLRYGRWRDPTTSGAGAFRKFFDRYPCTTVILINLTDTFKGSFPRDICGKQMLRLAQVVQEAARRAGLSSGGRDGLVEANCCILPSLGYSDYCILMAEEQWSAALPLMEELHRAVACPVGRERDEKSKKVPVLSTDYIMPVYHAAKGKKNFFGSPGSGEGKEAARRSVRVNLWPGVDMGRLQEAAGKDVEVYQTSGATDCLLVTDDPNKIQRILGQLIQGRSRNGMLNLAVATEGTLCRRVENRKLLSATGGTRSDRLGEVIQKLRGALREYGDCLGELRHKRQLSAAHQQVSAIENICGQCHNASLQRIMKDWLAAFTDSLTKCTNALKEAKKQKDQAKEQRLCRQAERALDIFIDEVGSFMADLSRSDCFFFESEQCDHPSVSSATALLIAYNHWHNSFVRDVVAAEWKNKKGKRPTYPLLVRSGGCDKTHTKSLFQSLPLELTEDGSIREDVPLISQMSEMSLFDCSGAVFRMTHECMHFCGNRLRRERLDYIFDFISRYYGRVLSMQLLSPEAYVRRPVNRLREMGVFGGAYGRVSEEKLRRDLTGVWKVTCADLAQYISMQLKTMLKAAYNEENKEKPWLAPNYMSSMLEKWLQRQLSILFSCYDYTDKDKSGPDDKPKRDSGNRPKKYRPNALVEALYRAHKEAVTELYGKYDRIVRQLDENLDIFELERRHIDQTEEQDKAEGNRHGDTVLERTIIHMLNQFLIRKTYSGAQDDPAIVGRVSEVVDVITMAYGCFNECFSDLQACLRLSASLADYVLSFVFETWDLEESLPVTPLMSLRVSAVLRVQFSGQLKDGALSDDARGELERAVIGLANCGLPRERIDAEKLIERVNALLKRSEALPGEAEALEGYLTQCRGRYKDPAAMEPYQKAFQVLREFRDGGDAKIAPEDRAVKMFAKLTGIGGETSEKRKDAGVPLPEAVLSR